MTTIFTHTDSYGGDLIIEAGSETGVVLEISTTDGDTVYFNRGDVGRLISAVAAYAITVDPAPAPAIVVGQEYKLLPGARNERYAIDDTGATRVRVVKDRDSDGEHLVTYVDGADRGESAYVFPWYLAELDESHACVPLTALATTDEPAVSAIDEQREAAATRAVEILHEPMGNALNITGTGVVELARFLMGEDY